MVISDAKSSILRSIRVRVADKRALPVVMEDVIRNGDPVRAVGNIKETIVVIPIV